MRRLLACVLLVTVVNLVSAAAFARTPMHFERLGISDGLSQQSANAIVQDASGFIWIGTEDGLNRYNGYSIQHVRRVRAQKEGLPDNYVASMQTDAEGRLWVATDGGGLAHQTGSATTFGVVSAAVEAGLERIKVVRFDRSGQLWIGAREGGLAMLDASRGKVTRWRHDPTRLRSLASNVVLSLLESRRGGMWIGTDRGLDRVGAKSRTWSTFRCVRSQARSPPKCAHCWKTIRVRCGSAPTQV